MTATTSSPAFARPLAVSPAALSSSSRVTWRNNIPVAAPASERNLATRELFAPLAETYDRYARLLSFGQDPRWRSFLASRLTVEPRDTVLDVASGTAAVAVEVARRHGCQVMGIDQSPEMLAEGRRRIEAAGLGDRIELVQGRAEALPYEDARFAGLTFTYLLRYVDDPAATMRELARVVRPGGRIAMLEFGVPPRVIPRAAWESYVRFGLPLAGRALSQGWADVGGFLGPSIRGFWDRWPPERLRGVWEGAGITDVRARFLSLGGGIVMWGVRGD
jgi:demethylmenaquinone methyltransferase / 2-methoxy-6-polyprenyl-1,4-benzoquinol methylase